MNVPRPDAVSGAIAGLEFARLRALIHREPAHLRYLAERVLPAWRTQMETVMPTLYRKPPWAKRPVGQASCDWSPGDAHAPE